MITGFPSVAVICRAISDLRNGSSVERHNDGENQPSIALDPVVARDYHYNVTHIEPQYDKVETCVSVR